MAADCCMLMCELCCAIFTKSSNLNRHIRNVHYPVKEFMCEHCSKSYNTKCSLMRHIASNHSVNVKNKTVVYWQCPICIFKNTKEAIVEHYRIVHNIDTSLSSINFDSLDEFQRWKQNIENETCSKYIRYRNKKCCGKLRYFYRCHRDGFYKSRGNNVRRLKKIGSNKINAHCPAKIDVIVNKTTGAVSIKYMKSHVGHNIETSTFSDRKDLANKALDEKSKDEDIHSEADLNVNDKKINISGTEKNYLYRISNHAPIRTLETNNVKTDIEVIKASLLEKFQLLLTEIDNLEESKIVSKELSDMENSLYKYKCGLRRT